MIGSCPNNYPGTVLHWRHLSRSIMASWTPTLDILDMSRILKMKSTSLEPMRRPVHLTKEDDGEFSMRMRNGMKNTTCRVLLCVTANSERSYAALRADYADDEYIQELIKWVHPHIAALGEVKYTEGENLVMMRLPRKECKFRVVLYTLLSLTPINSRSRNPDPNSLSLSHPRHPTFLICI